jgi:hypothetical protein
MVNAFYGIFYGGALAGGSAFCFLVVRVFLAADQQRVRSRWSRDVLRLGAYDRCNAQLEFFNGFDFALSGWLHPTG